MHSLTCPDCNAHIQKKDIKKHIQQCIKYRPIFLPHLVSVSQHLDRNQLQFQIEQIQLVSDQLKTRLIKSSEKEKNVFNQQQSRQKKLINQKLNIEDSQSEQQIVIKKNYYSLMGNTHQSEIKHNDLEAKDKQKNTTNNTKQKQSQKQLFNQPSTQAKEQQKTQRVIACSFCTFQFQFEPSSIQKLKISKLKTMSKRQLQDYTNNRAVCPMCDQQQCCKCKIRPYHTGKKCQYNRKKSGQFGSKQKSDFCQIHGKQYIIHKCHYCCSVSSWKWGDKYLCENCNTKHGKSQRQKQKYFVEVQKCKGYGICPIGGKHQQNGKECILGCALCKQF